MGRGGIVVIGAMVVGILAVAAAVVVYLIARANEGFNKTLCGIPVVGGLVGSNCDHKQECGAGTHWDAAANNGKGQCVSDATVLKCGIGSHPDYASGTCKPDIEIPIYQKCGEGQTLVERSGGKVCVPNDEVYGNLPSCPTGYQATWSTTASRPASPYWHCDKAESCPTGYVWNSQYGRCIQLVNPNAGTSDCVRTVDFDDEATRKYWAARYYNETGTPDGYLTLSGAISWIHFIQRQPDNGSCVKYQGLTINSSGSNTTAYQQGLKIMIYKDGHVVRK